MAQINAKKMKEKCSKGQSVNESVVFRGVSGGKT